MKAMVYRNYGSPDNLELQEIDMPVVKDDTVFSTTTNVVEIPQLMWSGIVLQTALFV